MTSRRKLKEHWSINVPASIATAVLAALMILAIKQGLRAAGKPHLAGEL